MLNHSALSKVEIEFIDVTIVSFDVLCHDYGRKLDQWAWFLGDEDNMSSTTYFQMWSNVKFDPLNLFLWVSMQNLPRETFLFHGEGTNKDIPTYLEHVNCCMRCIVWVIKQKF
jgi:hypothetical protein